MNRGAGVPAGLVTALVDDDPRRVGPYRLTGRLGQGGQGTVYLATDPTGRRVAVKVLLPEVVADPAARARLDAEVALALRVPPFCTARLLDASTSGDRPYLVTEFVPGPSLADRVRRDGPLTGSDLDRLMVATITALVTIHGAGVVHHDLKPANILLGPDGPRVVDFGIALRPGQRDPQADATGVLGSAAYLAPERLDAGPATPASDLFAWAAVMVYAAAGRSPFHAATTTGVVRRIEHDEPTLDGLRDDLRPLFTACLSRSVRRRPSARQVLDRLLEALQPGDDGQRLEPGPATSGVPAWGTPGAVAPAAPPPNPATPKIKITDRRGLGRRTPERVRRPAPSRPRRTWRRWALAAGALLVVLTGASRLPHHAPPGPPRASGVGVAQANVPSDRNGPVSLAPTVALDGDRVLVVSRFSPLQVWTTPRGAAGPLRPSTVLPGGNDTVRVAFSRDARTAAMLSLVDRVGLVLTLADVSTGRRIGTDRIGPLVDTVTAGETERPEVGPVGVTPDGTTVAVAERAAGDGSSLAGRGRVVVWRGLSAPARTFEVPDLQDEQVALTDDGTLAAYKHGTGTGTGNWALIRLDDPAASPVELVGCRKDLAEVPGPPRPDGVAFACTGDDGLLRVGRDGSLRGAAVAARCSWSVRARSLAVSPSGLTAACLGYQRVDGKLTDALVVVSLTGGPPTVRSLPAGYPIALAWAPDGRQVAVVTREQVSLVPVTG